MSTLSSIYNVSAVATTVNIKQLSDLSRFLLTHRDIVLDDTMCQALFQTRGAAATAFRTVYNRVIESGLRGQFTLLRIPKSVTNVPEVITYTHVPFDVKQMGVVIPHDIAALRTIPEYADKLIINTTAMLYADGTLANPAALQATVVRDALSRAYSQDPQKWLIPQLIQLICGVYSMSLSSILAQRFMLTWEDQQALAVVFAYYYWQLCATADDAKQALMSRTRELNLPDPAVVADVIGVVDAKRHGNAPLTLDQVCLAAMDLQITRLRVNRRVLNEFLRWVGPDVQSSAIALEYPPYWATFMLQADAGYHIGLSNIIKKNRYALRANEQFADLMSRAASGAALEGLKIEDDEASQEGYGQHFIRLMLGQTREPITNETVQALSARLSDHVKADLNPARSVIGRFNRYGKTFNQRVLNAMVFQPTHSVGGALGAINAYDKLIHAMNDVVSLTGDDVDQFIARADEIIHKASYKFDLHVTKRGLKQPKTDYGHGKTSPYISDASERIGDLGYTSIAAVSKVAYTALTLIKRLMTELPVIGSKIVRRNQGVRPYDPQADIAHIQWHILSALVVKIMEDYRDIMGDLRHVDRAIEDADENDDSHPRFLECLQFACGTLRARLPAIRLQARD